MSPTVEVEVAARPIVVLLPTVVVPVAAASKVMVLPLMVSDSPPSAVIVAAARWVPAEGFSEVAAVTAAAPLSSRATERVEAPAT